MDTNILAAILTSTLFAAVVTGLLNYIINYKKIVAENLILERKLWRESMKEISYEIAQATNTKFLRLAITKLKVNINAYGQNNSSQYMLDGHIWELIKVFEADEKINTTKIMVYANSFTNMISTLIKYDWERSKSEIKGNSNIKGILVTNIMCILFGIISNIYDLYRKKIAVTESFLIELILITFAVGMFCICVYYLICKSTQYIFERWKTENTMKIRFAYYLLSVLVLFIMISNTCMTSDTINNFLGIQFKITAKFQTSGMLLGGVITLIHINELYINRMTYCKTIIKLVNCIEQKLQQL